MKIFIRFGDTIINLDRTMGFGVHDQKLWFTNGGSEDITIRFDSSEMAYNAFCSIAAKLGLSKSDELRERDRKDVI